MIWGMDTRQYWALVGEECRHQNRPPGGSPLAELQGRQAAVRVGGMSSACQELQQHVNTCNVQQKKTVEQAPLLCHMSGGWAHSWTHQAGTGSRHALKVQLGPIATCGQARLTCCCALASCACNPCTWAFSSFCSTLSWCQHPGQVPRAQLGQQQRGGERTPGCSAPCTATSFKGG